MRRLFVGKRLEAKFTEVSDVNYVEYSFQRREALRTDEALLAHTHFLWHVAEKDMDGRLDETSYLELFQRIAYVIVTNSTIESARNLAQRDWEYDARGRRYLLYSDFVDALFELCDLFCPFTDSHEYCVFLMDLRRAITTPQIDDTILQMTPTELHSVAKDCMPHRWRPLPELKKLSVKVMDASSSEALRIYRNGDWITGLEFTFDAEKLSFKAGLCAMHEAVFGTFSQKLHATAKGQMESEYRLYQAQPPLPSRQIREPVMVTALPPAKPAASASCVPYMTDHLRKEAWDPEVANLLQNLSPRPGICVVGPPRCGKTRLAKALATELGIAYFSISSALEHIAKTALPPSDSPTPQATLFAGIAAALKAGRAVSRPEAMSALLYYIGDSIHGAQGFILDDVYPHDAWGSDAFIDMHFTHLICLHGTHANAMEHAASLSLCPKRRELFSVRDLAQGVDGYVDFFIEKQPEISAPEEIRDIDTARGSAADGDAETPRAEEPEVLEGEDSPRPEVTQDDDAPFRVPLPSLDQFRRHAVVLPGRTLSVREFCLERFDTAFADFEKQLAKTTSAASPELQIVRIVFHQAALGILQVALQAIAGAQPPISRLPPSLSAFHVALPPEIATLSRGEQIRWLLFGDWSALVEDNGPLAAFKSFVPLTEPRKLSVFRSICPVERNGKTGQPAFAALFSGRIYLMASDQALCDFVKQPQRYLEAVVTPAKKLNLLAASTPLPHKLWVVSTQLKWPAIAAPSVKTIADEVAKLFRIATSVEPFDLLTPSISNPEYEEILRGGQSISHDRLAKDLVQMTSSKDCWVLHGVPVTETTWTSMKEQGVLPEMLVVLDLPPPAVDDNIPGAKDFSTKLQSLLTLVGTDAGISITKCAVDPLASADEVAISIRRQLDPAYSNRIDGLDEGFITGAAPLSPIAEEARKVNGACGSFCPVTFATAKMWRVVPGKSEWTSFVDQKRYVFAGAAEKAAFDRNPRRYIPSGALTTFRPVILLLGPSNSGRRSVTLALEEALGASSLSFTAIQEEFDRLVALESYRLDGNEIDDATKVQLYSGCMERALNNVDPTGYAPFVLPGFGFTTSRIPSVELVRHCIDRKWLPFVVVPLKLDEATAVKRAMKDWIYRPPKPETDDEDGNTQDNEETKEDPKEKKSRLAAEEATAREQEVERVTELVTAELEAWTATLELWTEQGAQISAVVDATRGPQRVIKDVMKAIHKSGIFKLRNFFCEVQKVPLSRMEALVAAGFWTMGHHGPHCPVVKTSPGLPDAQFCVEYRGRAYFPSNFDAFVATPWAFASAPTRPSPPVVCCAVIGAPRSGKTKAATGICGAFGWIYISPWLAIQWVLACQRDTTLWNQVQGVQDASQVPNEVLLDCIVARIRSFECQQRGWILDGFPTTWDQFQALQSMQDRSILPSLVVCLDSPLSTLMTYFKQDEEALLPGLLERMQRWLAERTPLIVSLIQTYGMGYVKLVDTTLKSEWKVMAEVQSLLCQVVDAHATYFQSLASHRAAPASGVRLSHSELQMHPVLTTHCPVALTHHQHLSQSQALDRYLLAEYQQYSYWLATHENLAAFLANPSAVIESIKLPLPIVRDVGMGTQLCHGMDLHVAFQGYCPVTFKEGKGKHDWSAIRKGNKYILAAIDQAIYCFVNHAAKHRFLLDPKAYTSLELPVKLPPLVDDLQSRLTLTTPGKLEQALSRATEEALLALGTERPKYPLIDTKSSAVMFIALFLKTKKRFSNQSLSRDQVDKLFNTFVQDCHLGQDIKELATPVGSAVKGVRSMREKGDAASDLPAKTARFDAIVASSIAIFRSFAADALQK
ncbi:hypothetical protein AeRB84_010851 [Aphanomyces euteiches]|nr:hypothetical protein AeRB84_010851 [Aphanomyces euteiches]